MAQRANSRGAQEMVEEIVRLIVADKLKPDQIDLIISVIAECETPPPMETFEDSRTQGVRSHSGDSSSRKRTQKAR